MESCLSRYRRLIFAILSILTTPILAFNTNNAVQMLILGIPLIIAALLVLTGIGACMLVLTSKFEWYIFKDQNIFKDWWHLYRINISSLLWTLVYFSITLSVLILITFVFPPMESIGPVAVPISFAIIFMLMKLRRTHYTTMNHHVKMQFILFNTIVSIVFGLIIVLKMYGLIVSAALGLIIYIFLKIKQRNDSSKQ
jgi:hypothetical protein